MLYLAKRLQTARLGFSYFSPPGLPGGGRSERPSPRQGYRVVTQRRSSVCSNRAAFVLAREWHRRRDAGGSAAFPTELAGLVQGFLRGKL